jgi:hypothetical protein
VAAIWVGVLSGGSKPSAGKFAQILLDTFVALHGPKLANDFCSN